MLIRCFLSPFPRRKKINPKPSWYVILFSSTFPNLVSSLHYRFSVMSYERCTATGHLGGGAGQRVKLNRSCIIRVRLSFSPASLCRLSRGCAVQRASFCLSAFLHSHSSAEKRRRLHFPRLTHSFVTLYFIAYDDDITCPEAWRRCGRFLVFRKSNHSSKILY